MLLNRENIPNTAVMIQPSLISYSFNSLPAPALLDVASISADRILLLDSYFSVVIFHGMTIAQWRNMGYQNQPEHQVLIISILLSFWIWLWKACEDIGSISSKMTNSSFGEHCNLLQLSSSVFYLGCQLLLCRINLLACMSSKAWPYPDILFGFSH